MEEKKATEENIVELDLNRLNKEQAHHIAFNIVFDIIEYIENNQEAYLKYLQDQDK